ncbi:PREDICTED: protein RETICULATA-RELATED 3, chloroplastic-like [Ipomoea nil]|uniref:protein RETICULATA-RELATED 3, chloroplastic-like n=1 Tax=Ipomoea nil TaxID=35883 RepID=UPI0009008A78|nr:PREDICTED: protein RETICULATA-RELATED 3, chloroplastic-like [Ipomoea nil]
MATLARLRHSAVAALSRNLSPPTRQFFSGRNPIFSGDCTSSQKAVSSFSKQSNLRSLLESRGFCSEAGRRSSFRPAAAFLAGWRSRVAADPQFPFKVAMEQLVGVSACVAGDMATRPNFGLNELDFVFSTLIVSSILNFVLMYILAPTPSATQSLPSIFANCPRSHMFEPGNYGPFLRLGTFVYKGALFAAVGFCAGLVGTAISNGLVKMRKEMDPGFEAPNKPPPTILNAATWAIQMGVSSNLRYQALNGIEFWMAKAVPPLVFRSSVVVIRCLNNVVGGMSFVMLARLTGSQSVANQEKEKVTAPQ